jgi:hypothetical protein
MAHNIQGDVSTYRAYPVPRDRTQINADKKESMRLDTGSQEDFSDVDRFVTNGTTRYP